MSAGIGSVASGVTFDVGTKSAVKPGDNFNDPDPGMATVFTLGTSWSANWLLTAGFIPDPAWEVLPWTAGNFFTYRGYHYYWVGTHWYFGEGVSGPASIINSYNATTFSPFHPLMPKVAPANRATVVANCFTAPAGSAWTKDTHIWLWTGKWDGSAFVAVSYPPTNTNPKALWPGQILADPNITSTAQAASIPGLGYVPGFTSGWKMGAQFPWGTTQANFSVTFQSGSGNPYRYWWDGTAWQATTMPTGAVNTVANGGNYTDAYLASFADNEKCATALMMGYCGSGSSSTSNWTSGQSCTLAGKQMFWSTNPGNNKGHLQPGAAP